MDILTSSAECLNKSLFYLATENMPRKSGCRDIYAVCADVFNAKVHIFNACTTALIACVTFGVFGTMAPASAIFVGSCSLFGRKVTDESFNIMLPGFIRSFAPNTLKPKSLLSCDEIVILYDTTSRSFFG